MPRTGLSREEQMLNRRMKRQARLQRLMKKSYEEPLVSDYEREEDIYWAKLADQRMSSLDRGRPLCHEKVWREL